jgi:hypothetical protein
VTQKPSVTVLFPDQGESLASFERRITKTKGDMLVVFSDLELPLTKEKEARKRMMSVCKKFSTRLRIASRNTVVIRAARAKGIRVIESVADLKKFLRDSDQLDDALREFQPHIWRQQLRSRLQTMGLLSLPKLRIWALIGVSTFLFGFVVFRLLPSATVKVWPREETISQTANIFLAQSGAIVDLPKRVRVMELLPIVVRVDRTITFDQISRQFIGKNSTTMMKVVNHSDETYWLKTGTRVRNQAGMTFRLRDSIKVDPIDEVLVVAEAEPEDLYGEIVGERGNVPADLKWYLPGLTTDEQQLVYAVNIEPGKGGESKYNTVLSEDDILIGKEQLKTELLAEAKRLVNEQRDVINADSDLTFIEILHYDELTKVEYLDFVMPEQFMGQKVGSVPIEGSVMYTMYAYDTQEVLNMLSRELKTHVGEGKRLLETTLDLSRLVAHVIDYENDFSWIKLTVDLSGTVQHILDPLSPTGAVFAKKVRENVVGIHKDDAERIVSNYPEVKRGEVSVWPFWNRYLPTIATSIIIEPVME